MNWDAVGSIGEIIAAGGVIASLLYLAFETRNNTKIHRASLTNSALNSTAELNDLVFTDPELRKALSRVLDPNIAEGDFNSEDWELVVYFGRALFMRLEGMYILYKQGLIDDNIWQSRISMGAGVVQIPIFARYWSEDQNSNIYTQEFVDVVNSVAEPKYFTPKNPDAA